MFIHEGVGQGSVIADLPSRAMAAQTRQGRVLANLSRYSDLIDCDRRQYWRDWQLEVRENKQLRENLSSSLEEAREAREKASRAESGRRSLSRSLQKLNSEKALMPKLCSQCAKGYDHVRRSNQKLVELNRALEEQVAAEKQLRSELRRAIKGRLISVERERSLMQSENRALYDRIDQLNKLLEEQRGWRSSQSIVSYPFISLSQVEIRDASTTPQNHFARDAFTETRTGVGKLKRSNSRNDSLHRCRE